MILAHLSGLPPLFLTVWVCLRDCNVCELDSLMKMRNNSMKLGNSRWKYHRKTPSFRKTWNEMLNFAFVLSFWTRKLDVREQEWCLEQSQNLGSSESSKSSMTLWNNVELNWGEKCSDNGRCVSSMSMRGCQNSKAPMNCADYASDNFIPGNFTEKMKPANIVTVCEFLGRLKWKCLHPCDYQESLKSVKKSDYKMLKWNK